jgi:hypothetical protein
LRKVSTIIVLEMDGRWVGAVKECNGLFLNSAQVVCLLEHRDVNTGLGGPLFPLTRNLIDLPPNLG